MLSYTSLLARELAKLALSISVVLLKECKYISIIAWTCAETWKNPKEERGSCIHNLVGSFSLIRV